MVNLKSFWSKKTLIGLGLGQFVSLLITSTGFSSSELARKGEIFYKKKISVPLLFRIFSLIFEALGFGCLVKEHFF